MTYISFSAGGRRCLGEFLAKLEGLLILATVTSKFRLRLVEEQTIQPDPVMTLRPNAPVQMIVQQIDVLKPQPTIA